VIRKGFYVHYKGGIYFVQGLAVNHDGKPFAVIYESTQGCGDELHRARDGVIQVVDNRPDASYRSVQEFTERVDPVTGEPWEGGVPRFQRVVGWLRGVPLVEVAERRAEPFVTRHQD
jgi:hypothetical protein